MYGPLKTEYLEYARNPLLWEEGWLRIKEMLQSNL
jgi:hypothetical protein